MSLSVGNQNHSRAPAHKGSEEGKGGVRKGKDPKARRTRERYIATTWKITLTKAQGYTNSCLLSGIQIGKEKGRKKKRLGHKATR